MRIPVTYGYHLYLNHPCGSRLAKTTQGVCYWKGLVTQAYMYAKTCKTFQNLKKIKALYGCLSPKNITELNCGIWCMWT